MIKKNSPSIKKNLVVMMFYRFFATLAPLITTPYICRVLLPSDIGDYAFAQNITAYFSALAALGANIYGQREVAYVRDDKNKLSKTFYGVLYCRVISCIISVIFFIIIINFFIDKKYITYFSILIYEIIFGLFDLSWFYTGMENFTKVALRYIVFRVITIVLVFTLVKQSSDIYKYVLINSLSISLSNFIFVLGYNKYVDFVSIVKSKFYKHFKYILLLFIPTIASMIYSKIDITMLGILCSRSEEIAYYQQAMKIVIISECTIGVISGVFVPRLAYAYTSLGTEEFKYYFYKGFDALMILAIPFSIGLYFISDSFVPLFFGSQYIKVSLFLKCLAPICFVTTMKEYIGTQYLYVTKREKAYIYSIVFATLINMMLNYLTIKKLFGIGAIISSFVSELIVLIVICVYVKKQIDFDIIFSKIFKKIVASLLMVFFIVLVNINILNSAMSLLFKILFSAIIYFIALYLLKDELFINIFNDICKKVIKKVDYD